MYMRLVRIRNFRRLVNVDIPLSKGVNVLVGENNIGKTTVVDAIRLLLIHGSESLSLSIDEDDFTEGKSPKRPIEISGVFTDLSLPEEALLYQTLVRTADSFEAHIHVRYEISERGLRPTPKWWGGETEGGSFPSNIWQYISSIYLPPLRDPTRGLRPGRRSQVARLVRHLANEEEADEFELIAKNANKDMLKVKAVKTADSAVDKGLEVWPGTPYLVFGYNCAF